jgi:threonyl-tRNA synthetase
MITLTFPDGGRREFPKGTTGREVAASIAKSLEKKAVAMKLDGKVRDLADPIESDAENRDPDTRVAGGAGTHPARLRPRHGRGGAGAVSGHQVTIGPVIENGFFYDFYRPDPVHAPRTCR